MIWIIQMRQLKRKRKEPKVQRKRSKEFFINQISSNWIFPILKPKLNFVVSKTPICHVNSYLKGSMNIMKIENTYMKYR